MKINKWQLFLGLVIVIVGVGLRFYQLGAVPIELNRDEASLGYTAYSLLKTGKEEHGFSWPINVKSFGDWKLPVYIYTLMPFIGALGLESWVVKLPSALAGSAIIVLGGILTFLLKKNANLSLLTMLFLAISPWGIHLSHMAYEANLAMFLFLCGLITFLLSLKHRPQWLLASATFFGLTLFTYHSYQVLTPLLAIGLLFIYAPEIPKFWQKQRPIFIGAGAIATFFSATLVFTSISANQTKFAALSIFDKKAYLPQIEVNRSYFADRNSLAAKLHDNTLALFLNQVQHNIADLYSARFLFFEGGGHGSHDIPGTGKMYPVQIVFLILGAYGILVAWKKNNLSRGDKLLSWWLLAASVPPLITFQAAHTIRYSGALFPLSFLSALGILAIINSRAKITKWLSLGLLSLILFYSTVYFLLTYFIVAPRRDINNQDWAVQRLISLINERGSDYDQIYLPGTTWSPYVYFLFHNKIDPQTLSTDLEFYPTGSDGFQHVKRLGKINFGPIDWTEGEPREKILYVIKKKEVPGDKFERSDYSLEYSLTNPDAKDEWLLLSHQATQ